VINYGGDYETGLLNFLDEFFLATRFALQEGSPDHVFCDDGLFRSTFLQVALKPPSAV
jgi:hypothetical protein